MMKFFRKHNKKLLAVFMVGLMVVFIGGSALENMLAPSGNQVIAQSSLGSISTSDIQQANNVTSILDRRFIDWQRPYPGAVEAIEAIDWVLLTREAAALGFAPNVAEIRSSFPSDDLAALSRQMGIKSEHILRASAELRSIQLTTDALKAAVIPSEAEIRVAAHKTMEKLKINAVMLPAKAFEEESWSFSAGELTAQFEKYREKEAGTGLNFGYYVEPSIKLQYIKIDRNILAQEVGVANLQRKAKAYYDQRKETDPDFQKSHEQAHAEAEPGATFEENHSHTLSWEEAKEKAVAAIRRQEAVLVASRMADYLAQSTVDSWLEVARSTTGYRPTPEEVKELGHYNDIVKRLPRNFAYPRSISTGVTDFFTMGEVADVEELGTAGYIPEGTSGRRLSLKELAFNNAWLIPKVPDTKGTNPSDYLSKFETCRLPLSTKDAVYLFRVVDFHEAHVPESLDEVRDRVLVDIRLAKAFEEASFRAESLRNDETTLLEAYDNEADLKELLENSGIAVSGYFDVPAFARVNQWSIFVSLKQDSSFVAGGIGRLPMSVVDACFALRDSDEKINVFPLEDRAAHLIVEWVETQPASVEEFDQTRATFAGQLTATRQRFMVADWLRPSNIRARNGFKVIEN